MQQELSGLAFEGRGIMFPWNIGLFPDCTGLQTRRFHCSLSLAWEHHFCHGFKMSDIISLIYCPLTVILIECPWKSSHSLQLLLLLLHVLFVFFIHSVQARSHTHVSASSATITYVTAYLHTVSQVRYVHTAESDVPLCKEAGCELYVLRVLSQWIHDQNLNIDQSVEEWKSLLWCTSFFFLLKNLREKCMVHYGNLYLNLICICACI
jgi:hypothetical protein